MCKRTEAAEHTNEIFKPDSKKQTDKTLAITNEKVNTRKTALFVDKSLCNERSRFI